MKNDFIKLNLQPSKKKNEAKGISVIRHICDKLKNKAYIFSGFDSRSSTKL